MVYRMILSLQFIKNHKINTKNNESFYYFSFKISSIFIIFVTQIHISNI